MDLQTALARVMSPIMGRCVERRCSETLNRPNPPKISESGRATYSRQIKRTISALEQDRPVVLGRLAEMVS